MKAFPGTPAAAVDRVYELLGDAAAGRPDWDSFRALFLDSCTIVLRADPQDDALTVLDLDGYVAHHSGERPNIGGERVTGEWQVQVAGDVAVVQQQARTSPDEAPLDTIDLFSVAKVDGEWKVVNVVSDLA